MDGEGFTRCRTCPEILMSAVLTEETFRLLWSMLVACRTAKAIVWPVLTSAVNKSPSINNEMPIRGSLDWLVEGLRK
jgi:hypothetical protein